MAIKEEIAALIVTLQNQLENFKDIPDDRLEAFMDVCIDQLDNYSDERIETREAKLAILCIEADVRSPTNIGHCGDYTDYVWKDDEWQTGEEGEDEDDEEEEEEDAEDE
jgi:hypothetical protein